MLPLKKTDLQPSNSSSVLAAHLHRLMRENAINEATLARKTGIPQPTLHKILTGKTTDPRISTLHSLANYFGLTVDELLSYPHSSLTEGKNSQNTPILSWTECLQLDQKLEEITPNSWDAWVVTELLATNHAYALISKPSMEPRFPQGTILIIDPETAPNDGDLVVVHYKNSPEATLRRISIDGPDRQLLPLNNYTKADNLSHDIALLGTVIQAKFSFS